MALHEFPPKLSTEEYEANFADISPLMTPRQAAIEAARCLFCFDAPCTIACPTHIDVPAFIKKISTNNLRGSARVILSANILGESCGRVCPTEALCEGACVMNEKGEEAIEIGRLQRNYQFLSYGLVAAWIILVVYVLMMTGRQRRLKREIASLRAMLEDKKRLS